MTHPHINHLRRHGNRAIILSQSFPGFPGIISPWSILPLDQNIPEASGYAIASPGLQPCALVPSELLLIYKYLVINTYNMIGNTS